MSGSATKRKMHETPEKPPAMILNDLCVQHKTFAMFDYDRDETDPNLFCCNATAFGFSAEGSARTKKEAKHVASANLIGVLRNTDRFKQNLPVSQAQRSTFKNDAVCPLLDICVQRNWPIAEFKELESFGEPHRPTFTVICQLSTIKQTGTSSQKREAKQIAARKMLDLVQNAYQNEEDLQVALVQPVAEPPEKLFRTYRELKDAGIKPTVVRIRDRHNFLLKLPKEDRDEAATILMDNSLASYGTNKDKVQMVCDALKIKYNVKDVPDHPKSFKVFYMQSNNDCVFTGKEDELYDRIVEYFKTMLNLQKH